jgi:fructose-1,6-bisphosphatase
LLKESEDSNKNYNSDYFFNMIAQRNKHCTKNGIFDRQCLFSTEKLTGKIKEKV